MRTKLYYKSWEILWTICMPVVQNNNNVPFDNNFLFDQDQDQVLETLGSCDNQLAAWPKSCPISYRKCISRRNHIWYDYKKNGHVKEKPYDMLATKKIFMVLDSNCNLFVAIMKNYLLCCGSCPCNAARLCFKTFTTLALGHGTYALINQEPRS